LTFLINVKGSRELYVRKLMYTYGYDRENAEKAYEYLKYKRAQFTLGINLYSFESEFNISYRSIYWYCGSYLWKTTLKKCCKL